MAKLKIPAGPDDITTEWLTHALRRTGTLTNATVGSFDAETIAEGVGLLGQLARVSPGRETIVINGRAGIAFLGLPHDATVGQVNALDDSPIILQNR